MYVTFPFTDVSKIFIILTARNIFLFSCYGLWVKYKEKPTLAAGSSTPNYY